MAICICSRDLLVFEEWMVYCGPPQHLLRSLVSLLALEGTLSWCQLLLSTISTVCLQLTGPQILPCFSDPKPLWFSGLWAPPSPFIRAHGGSEVSCRLWSPVASGSCALSLSPIPLYCLFPSFWILCQFKYRASSSLQPSLGYFHGSGPRPATSLCSLILTWLFAYLNLQSWESRRKQGLCVSFSPLPLLLPPACPLLRSETVSFTSLSNSTETCPGLFPSPQSVIYISHFPGNHTDRKEAAGQWGFKLKEREMRNMFI